MRSRFNVEVQSRCSRGSEERDLGQPSQEIRLEIRTNRAKWLPMNYEFFHSGVPDSIEKLEKRGATGVKRRRG